MTSIPERTVLRREKDRLMAESFSFFKKYVWLGPVVVSLLMLLGFSWLTPSDRLEAVEQVQKEMPRLVQAAIDSQVQPLWQAIEAQRLRDSLTQIQLLQMGRTLAVGTLLQCRDLPPREAEFLRQLAQFCDLTSQRSGIPYRRP